MGPREDPWGKLEAEKKAARKVFVEDFVLSAYSMGSAQGTDVQPEGVRLWRRDRQLLPRCRRRRLDVQTWTRRGADADFEAFPTQPLVLFQ
jgi:hypothetical protein